MTINSSLFRKIQIFFELLASVATLAFLSLQIDWWQFSFLIYNLDWEHIVIGFILFSIQDVCRAIRYGYLVSSPVFSLIPAVVLHQWLVTILPFRMGELSFPYFLRRLGVPLIPGLGALIAVRLMDLSIVAMALLVLCPHLWGDAPASTSIAVFTPSVVFAVLLLSGSVLGVSRLIAHSYRLGLSWFSILISKFNAEIDEISRFLINFRTKIPLIFTLSLFIWIENSLVSLFLLRSVGISLNFPQAAFVASWTQLVSVVPGTIMGGLGISDLSLAWLLTLYGMSAQQAAASVMVTRLLFSAYLLVWGAIGWIGWVVQANVISRRPGTPD